MGADFIAASRIVVVMPNWLGDGVMATPFLRALRRVYPAAHIAAVARPLVAPVLAVGKSDPPANPPNHQARVDEVKVYEKGEEGPVAKWMQEQKFELGILLPNSFRSAWMLWRGAVKRRLGYARGGRSLLLTDSISAIKKTSKQRVKDRGKVFVRRVINGCGRLPTSAELTEATRLHGRLFPRFSFHYEHRTLRGIDDENSKLFVSFPVAYKFLPRGFQPIPTIEYYLDLSRYLGGGALPPASRGLYGDDERRMELGVTVAEREEAERGLRAMGIQADDAFVVMVPGANFGASKCWLPERFAEVADRLAEANGAFGAKVVLAGGPGELPIVETILAACKQKERIAATAKINGGKGISIGALKEIVRRSTLMLCNDTGPRHFAAAFGVPLVTLFGPTDPVWAQTYAANERIVRIDVPCGPCQLKKCPIDHRCMRGITVEMVMHQIADLWPRPAAAAQPASRAPEAGG